MLQRVGRPQYFALLLLVAFLAQAAWLAAHSRIERFPTAHIAGESARQPGWMALHYLPRLGDPATPLGRVLAVSPILLAGALVGAALWYVSRRLYGNRGGFLALALYCFSPAAISHSARLDPLTLAAFGAYGLVFTGIATAHTLYAPREVVLWNWRRILLLAAAIGVGLAGTWAVALLLPLTFALMVYLVPERKLASLAILGSATAIALAALALLFGPSTLVRDFAERGPIRFTEQFLLMAGAWRMLGIYLLHNGVGFVLLMMIALGTYLAWRHTRYFGTHAPLIVAAACLLIAFATPVAAGLGFLGVALPFLLTFIAGICADLLETRRERLRNVMTGVVFAVIVTQAMYSLAGLAAAGRPTVIQPAGAAHELSRR